MYPWAGMLAAIHGLWVWAEASFASRCRTKKYEFGDSDIRVGIDTVDAWIDMIARGKANISPDDIPWPALRCLLASSVYGMHGYIFSLHLQIKRMTVGRPLRLLPRRRKSKNPHT